MKIRLVQMDGHDEDNNLFSHFAKPRKHKWHGTMTKQG